MSEALTYADLDQEHFKSGFVALVGRPNAGKSTLLNALLGEKLAITSDTAQTTRHRFRGIITQKDFQAILVDTPGLHKPIGTGDEWVAKQVNAARGAKRICVLSKTDIASADQISKQREAADTLCRWDAMVALSAVSGKNIDAFLEEIVFFLPKGPAWFPPDMKTDQPLEVIIAEFIREKILRSFDEEIPHAIGVQCEELEYERKKDLYRIFANIYVERDSQKGIIIGKKGNAIKQIGTEARADLEQLLGCRVWLDLRVKVKKNWRKDANQIRRFGYGEGA